MAVAVVAAAFVLVQLLLVVPGSGLGWDETVYVSQVNPHVPTAFFSAPRARGVTLLVAPVAWTDSTTVLRIYLALASGLALYLALRVWRRLQPPGVLALAGLLFGGLWVTLFYGPQAMPNLWVALAALAAAGCFLRAARDPRDRAALLGLGGNVAAVTLLRPMDAVWLALPLLAVAPLARRGRRRTLLGVLVAGLALGSAEWVVEAYVSYGGLAARLDRSSEIQDGLGWHLAVVDQIRSLGGRTLCRPCTGPLPGPLVWLWWVLTPVLAAVGVLAAVRGRHPARALLPTLCALAMAVPYLFFIGYAAARFLLPAYALIALPAAAGIHWLSAAAGPGRRPIVTTVLGLGLAGHLALQGVILVHTVKNGRATSTQYALIAERLHGLGVRPPCLLTGEAAIPVAYYAGCHSADTGGNNGNMTPADVLTTATHDPVAVLFPTDGRLPDYARTWRVIPLTGAGLEPGYRVVVAPGVLR
ncbi:hypothetical protein AB0I82_05900 [Streptomyces sp. NPDC050315]|uniref:hypothetical protein n=1 Tax=Streptomyces sp. NPDC050315 TaxID=3155039 RepID=UPI0034123F64